MNIWIVVVFNAAFRNMSKCFMCRSILSVFTIRILIELKVNERTQSAVIQWGVVERECNVALSGCSKYTSMCHVLSVN